MRSLLIKTFNLSKHLINKASWRNYSGLLLCPVVDCFFSILLKQNSSAKSYSFLGVFLEVGLLCISTQIYYSLSRKFSYTAICVFSSIPVFSNCNLLCQGFLNMANQCNFTCGIILFELAHLKK